MREKILVLVLNFTNQHFRLLKTKSSYFQNRRQTNRSDQPNLLKVITLSVGLWKK